MMGQSGYSSTPLPRKLGLKEGQAVAFVGLPQELSHLADEQAFAFVETPAKCEDMTGTGLDFIQFFTSSAETLRRALPQLKTRIHPAGMIWVSWPKKASNVPSDVTEDVIRNVALADILVDVKVCAVDMIWSGLKLVIRKELRTDLV